MDLDVISDRQPGARIGTQDVALEHGGGGSPGGRRGLAGDNSEDQASKRERAKTEGVAAWVDPEGYRLWVWERKQDFEKAVNVEMGVTVAE